MPAATPFPPSHSPPVPALYLYPLNDTFVPKHIILPHGQHVKVGRQTNNKTVPGERNGYFDSKVLSRQHAEVWEESGKIYIKDVKSSNGTFINGERLSQEGMESEPFELKSDDVVEFGIDIVGEDNKTIIHHKVAARVTCILTAEDAVAASRDSYQFQPQSQQPGSSAGVASTLNGSGQRRPNLQPQANGLGGMGGGLRQPGKSGLTFDHILSRLQGELTKSRETGAELGIVAGSMGEIGDVMSGGQPSNLPPYPHALPPVRAPQQHPPHSEADSSSSALQTLQTQLAETQASLSNHVEKIRALENLLSEHEGMKREVSALRDLIEERERQRMSMREHDHMVQEDDDDDRRSIHTITPHELESVPEEDESEVESDMEETDEERSARREELGRPRTPEPSSLGMVNGDYEDHESDHDPMHVHKRDSRQQLMVPQPSMVPDEVSRRLSMLADQVESALELSRNLQVQHTVAQQTIEHLEGKVTALEELVRASQVAKEADEAKLVAREEQRERERQTSLTAMMADFKKTIEDRWDSVKEDMDAERQRANKAREEWETRVKSAEDHMSSSISKVELGLASITSHLTGIKANGFVSKSGLVTPPSPRSLSSDSDRPRKKRSPSRRGRTKSRSPASTLVNPESVNGMSSSGASAHSRSSSSSTPPLPTDSESTSPDNGHFPSQFPLTPESSLLHMKAKADPLAPPIMTHQGQAVNNTQVAVGVFVLGVAAAAVLWRVKE
ncbi:hypothetical protein BD410DRAFT_785591 [Rickenella mellea]|uniref:FHA domain-containing protein n=1 Tax=Rickenella mellea TaxID=50990 RepID=A0A4Y7QB18_9AGAM|nr:hypothetical protein BD410DRAFT_785591 [Rickenella mellea]